MGEFMECLKERYSKNTQVDQKDLKLKERVRNSIMKSCEEYIQEAGDRYTFEVLPSELPYVVSVVMEEPIKSRYNISQIASTVFVAQLCEVDIGL